MQLTFSYIFLCFSVLQKTDKCRQCLLGNHKLLGTFSGHTKQPPEVKSGKQRSPKPRGRESDSTNSPNAIKRRQNIALSGLIIRHDTALTRPPHNIIMLMGQSSGHSRVSGQLKARLPTAVPNMEVINIYNICPTWRAL